MIAASKWEPKSDGDRESAAVTHAAELLGRLGLSSEMAFCVLDFWNAANLPPLTNEELQACISEAGKSCRAPIERERARHDPWEPIPASQLKADANIDWIWEEFLPVGHISLLSSLPKVGKTTLLAHLLYLMKEGGELGTTVKPARVLVISEETTGLWAKRRDEIDLADHVDFLIRPFPGKPTDTEWNEAIQTIARLIVERAYSLVVFDTLSHFNPAADENDAARMMKALAPLRQISDTGAAVLLLHHLRKGDGGQGQGTRGSGALMGFVDVSLELRRNIPNENSDRRRVITTYSRLVATPPELVLELTDNRYHCCGTVAEASQGDRLTVVGRILPAEPPGLTREEVREAWGPEYSIPRPGETTIRKDLNVGVDRGLWRRTGSGKSGDPYRFFRPGERSCRASSPPIGARHDPDPDETREEVESPDPGERTPVDGPRPSPTGTPSEPGPATGAPEGDD